MVINNFELISQLAKNVYELADYDELDLNNQHILDLLTKVKELNINFSSVDDLDNIENTIRQISILIEKCPNIESARIYSHSPYSKNLIINDLFNILSNHKVKRVYMSGFDYDYLPLYSKVLSPENETKFVIDKITNPVALFTYIFEKDKLRDKLYFYTHGNRELGNLYNELKKGIISFENYEKYKSYLTNYKDLYLSIGNVEELDLDKFKTIKNDSHLKGVHIRCGYNLQEDAHFYSFEEYESVRKVIDNIIQMIKMPKEDDPNRDKMIFAQIYKILGKNIRYDHYAISDEGRKDNTLSCNCRNLKNGLLGVERNNKKEFLTVCAGYATILQNICACFGIKCDYISSQSKEIEDPNDFIVSGPRMYENGTSDPKGHGYNAVYLDGKAYLCDLTWDADLMKLDKLGQHFLKSYDEFYLSHKDEGFSTDNVRVINQDGEEQKFLDKELFVNSFTNEEQIQLFGTAAKENIEEMVNEGYLADFAMKNVEYIKQVKGKVGMQDYIKLIQLIHSVEEYMKSPAFQERASWFALGVDSTVTDEKGNVIGKENFNIYPGMKKMSPSEAVNEVMNMEEKQWKMK